MDGGKKAVVWGINVCMFICVCVCAYVWTCVQVCLFIGCVSTRMVYKLCAFN